MIYNSDAYFTVPQGKVPGDSIIILLDAKNKIQIVVPEGLPEDAILRVPVKGISGVEFDLVSEVPIIEST